MGGVEQGRVTTGPVDNKFLNDLEAAVKRFSEVQGVFLAGSGAHDELLWWENESAKKLLSDVEVGIVISNYFRRKKIKETARNVGVKYSYDVEPFLLTPRRLSLGSPKNFSFRKHAPNILMYDLIESAKWIWKRLDYEASNIASADLPPWEAIRLILNRFGEGAELLLPWMQHREIADRAELSRWVIKILVAIGDAIMVSQGDYRPGYSRRASTWSEKKYKNHLTHDCGPTIYSAYMARAGEYFDLDIVDPDKVRSCARQVLFDLLGRHMAKKNMSSINVSTLDGWSECFRNRTIPVRYQAPFKALDGWYDSFFLIPGLWRSPHSIWVIPLALIKHRIPVQAYAYGVLACIIYSEDLEDGIRKAVSIMSRHIRPDANDTSATLVKAWWYAFCK